MIPLPYTERWEQEILGELISVCRDGVPYFLEINPLPSLCKGGSFELCAQSRGQTFADVLHDIVKSSIA